MPQFVEGSYPWPFDGHLEGDNTALLVVDMQVDFCAPGGWLDQLGVDLIGLRQPIGPLRRVLEAVRTSGFLTIYVRESYRPDLSDLNRTKRWRTEHRGLAIGESGVNGRILIRGERGSDIVSELAPEPSEPVIDKPGISGFYASELEQVLRGQGIRNLIVGGVTAEGSVQATLRDANDRGYECLLLEDCCGTADPKERKATLEMLGILNGLYGSIAHSTTLLRAIT